ncbi:MAG: erythronate-4-phosphate dehydrogenase [Bacteroidetes bacterium SW_9_63_38]|nr:MAG: erythronate-4-phosphate dehydrogenase [Bacteroidetes bacterium SW_9_63_38]
MNIPCVEAAFGALGDIVRAPGREIGPDAVEKADVLLVRSVTSVGEELLRDSAVQFVGSATIGTDHVDQDYLEAAGIPFAHAPASNADSVADYVVAALLQVAQARGVSLRGRTVGIVGCGNIGSRLARRLPALGLTVLQNDPPRAKAVDGPHTFVSLGTVLDRADIVTCHVPITTEGPHPTRHLLDAAALDRLSGDAWVVNTARGAVVDNEALLTALREDRIGGAVLDVWEGEPTPDPALVEAVDVATPHIAGYAYDGKVRGTTMLYEALCEYLGVEQTWNAKTVLQPEAPDVLRCQAPDPRLPRTDWLDHLAQQAYDLRADDARMRAYLDQVPDERGDYFRHLRATYPTRREMQIQAVLGTGVPPAYRPAVTDGLTVPCV